MWSIGGKGGCLWFMGDISETVSDIVTPCVLGRKI